MSEETRVKVETIRAAACHKHLPMMHRHVSYNGKYPVVVSEAPPTVVGEPDNFCSCGYRAKYVMRTYTSMTAAKETDISLAIDKPVVTG